MRDLEALFAPGSIAVAGASTDPNSWGYWLARAAVEGADRRPVHLVNPRGGELFGRPLRASLRELEGEADLVVVAVPERALETTVDDALAAGARSLVVITAGLGERDDHGRRRERALRERVRAAGAVMLGPNCIGVYDAAANLRISSNEYPAGPIGLISQSGNISLEIGLMLERGGLGLSRFASVGNQADVTLPELLVHLGAHEPTQAIAVYVEDVADGRAFVEAARAAAARTPVVVLAAGASEAGRRGAASHTGSLVSDRDVLRAACDAAGALLVDSPGQLADVLQALVRAPLPRGRRVAVIGDGGGHGAVCADLLAAHGLEVPELSPALVAALDEALPPHGGLDNPIDLIGVGDPDLDAFSTATRLVLDSGEVDAVAITGYLGGYALYSDAYVRSEPDEAGRLAALQAGGRTVLAHSMYGPAPGGASLRARGLAVFERTEQLAGAFAALERLAALREEPPPLAAPAAAVPLTGPVGYPEARALLAEAGVPYLDGALVAGVEEAVAEADGLALYPVTLKAVDETLLHKSDRGGVRVGLPDAGALRAAATEMVAALAPARLFVERTADADGAVELIVGARRDARFGAVVLVGLGGTLVEVLDDTALALAPIDAPHAARMLRSLRGAALLRGARGRPPVDVDAAAGAIAAVSRVAAAHPELAELEVNPLLAGPAGAVALDARAILRSEETP